MNTYTAAALRMTSLITRVRKPDVIHEMDRCAALVDTLLMTSRSLYWLNL